MKLKLMNTGNLFIFLDIEGNKIELWEPNDEEYEKILAVKMKS